MEQVKHNGTDSPEGAAPPQKTHTFSLPLTPAYWEPFTHTLHRHTMSSASDGLSDPRQVGKHEVKHSEVIG